MALTQKERSRKSYNDRKNKGLCPRFGKELDRKGHYCSECLIKEREYKRESREFYRRNGICPVCGKEILWGSEKQCITCREKSRQRKQRITDEQKNAYPPRGNKIAKVYSNDVHISTCGTGDLVTNEKIEDNILAFFTLVFISP